MPGMTPVAVARGAGDDARSRMATARRMSARDDVRSIVRPLIAVRLASFVMTPPNCSRASPGGLFAGSPRSGALLLHLRQVANTTCEVATRLAGVSGEHFALAQAKSSRPHPLMSVKQNLVSGRAPGIPVRFQKYTCKVLGQWQMRTR